MSIAAEPEDDRQRRGHRAASDMKLRLEAPIAGGTRHDTAFDVEERLRMRSTVGRTRELAARQRVRPYERPSLRSASCTSPPT